MSNIVDQIAREHMKSNVDRFEIGDTVEVYVKISEGGKERVQRFNGIVIARKGSGIGASFTVRRYVQNEGVERSFPLHSPSIDRIVVKSHGKVRRAKLYFLRGKIGKARRLAERRGLRRDEMESAQASQAAAEAPPAEEVPKEPEQAEKKEETK